MVERSAVDEHYSVCCFSNRSYRMTRTLCVSRHLPTGPVFESQSGDHNLFLKKDITSIMDETKESIKVYDKIAEKYTKTFFGDNSYEIFIKDFLRLIPKKGRILDVGCGPGGEVKSFIEGGFLAEGIDL